MLNYNIVVMLCLNHLKRTKLKTCFVRYCLLCCDELLYDDCVNVMMHVSDCAILFRNAQTILSTLQKKNPPQPPKPLTRASLPVKASQLSKLNPMSYILHSFISCTYHSCIITFGLGLLQLYQDKPHIPYTFPGIPRQNNLGGYVYC